MKKLLVKLFGQRPYSQAKRRNQSFRLALEALENRELMAVMAAGEWVGRPTENQTGTTQSSGESGGGTTRILTGQTLLGDRVGENSGTLQDPGPSPTAEGLALINGLPDAAVRTRALALYEADGVVSRNDMLDIFSNGTLAYTDLRNTAFDSLKTLVDNGAKVRMPDYVQDLASRVLARKPVGGTSPALTLQQSVFNFFKGLERPDGDRLNYREVDKPLWNGAPKAQDVYQTRYENSNWMLTGLEELVWRDTPKVAGMFIDNGDKTYTDRFYSRKDGTPFYVTVDNYLPEFGGTQLGDTSRSGVLWVALAIKAYAQASAYGGMVRSLDGISNSYKTLGLLTADENAANEATPSWAWEAITGLQGTSGAMSTSLIAQEWSKGRYVAMRTLDNSDLVGNTGSDPILYPECNANDRNCGGFLPHPRWYALVNYVDHPTRGELFTVTMDGKRVIEVPGSILTDNFERWVGSSGNPAPVPQKGSAAEAHFGSDLGAIEFHQLQALPTAKGGQGGDVANPGTTVINRAQSVTLETRGRGKAKKLVAVVKFTTGRPREVVAPFQKASFQAIKAALFDLNGDGTPDSVRFTALQGKKRISRTIAL